MPKERHGNNRPEAPIDVAEYIRQEDTGRFTNQFSRGHYDHSKKCYTCKKTGETTGPNRLWGCFYCTNSSHMWCIEKIFPVIQPRDDEDFLFITCMRGVRCRIKQVERRASLRMMTTRPVAAKKASLLPQERHENNRPAAPLDVAMFVRQVDTPYPIIVLGMAFDTNLGVVQICKRSADSKRLWPDQGVCGYDSGKEVVRLR